METDKVAVNLAGAVINADHVHIGQGDINIKGTGGKRAGGCNMNCLFTSQTTFNQTLN